MSRVKLAPKARKDLAGIWTYSADRWSEEHADRYLALLNREIVAVALKPQLGRTCNDIRAGYFKRAAGSHAIFYRVTGDGIEVVRVLHQRMDPARHV